MERIAETQGLFNLIITDAIQSIDADQEVKDALVKNCERVGCAVFNKERAKITHENTVRKEKEKLELWSVVKQRYLEGETLNELSVVYMRNPETIKHWIESVEWRTFLFNCKNKCKIKDTCNRQKRERCPKYKALGKDPFLCTETWKACRYTHKASYEKRMAMETNGKENQDKCD